MKQEIIDAVLLEIADDGLSNITLKAVAARADTSISLITHHFVNRAGLLAAVAERWEKRLKGAETECLAVFMEASTPIDGLEAAVVRALNIARAHQPEMRMVLRQVVIEHAIPTEIGNTTFPLAGRTAQLASSFFGISEQRAKAVLHQAAILITRMSLLADDELEQLYADEDHDLAAAWARCADHVARTIRLGLAEAQE